MAQHIPASPLSPTSGSARIRRQTTLRTLLALILTFALLVAVTPRMTLAAPAQSEPVQINALATGAVRSVLEQRAPKLTQTASDENEVKDLEIVPIDPNADPDAILRSRPFVLGPGSIDAFPPDQRVPSVMSEDHARDRLKRFLRLRHLDSDAITAAVARYDDPAVQQIVPAPTLRAALLMLTGWDPYQISIDAILDGNNPSGAPFESVDFGTIDISEAIATIETAWSGHMRMILNSAYEHEPPEQFIPVIVHESLHGGGVNSRQEEVIANILDAICYSEVLLTDPRVAAFGTDLTLFNNVEVLALLNSMGRAGGGELGISSSPLGDIFIGPNLDDFDAESIRAVIESDDFYGALPDLGSPGQATFDALIDRFPGASRLGSNPDFNNAALAVIDGGVGAIITPTEAVQLATLLGLDMTAGVIEGPDPVSAPTSLGERPFAPFNRDRFDRNDARPAGKLLSEKAGRAALADALDARKVAGSTRSRLLRQYSAPATTALVPDPSLRAAATLLGASSPWDASMAAVFDGENSAKKPLQIRFADLDGSMLVVRAAPDGRPAILINSWLEGERPELLATYIVEGTLLSEDAPTEDEAVAGALLGSLAYASVLLVDPDLAATETWGVIERNRDLLALLNSSAWMTRGDVANADSIGFLKASNGALDILPGLYADAPSFAAYIRSLPHLPKLEQQVNRVAQPAFDRYLSFVGIRVQSRGGDNVLDDQTMQALDARLGAFLNPEGALQLANVLSLGGTNS